MDKTAERTSLRFQVTVDAPRDVAFRVFVEDFDRIKPREHNLLPVAIAETVFEARAGGDVYDRGVDGSVCRWGRVLAFEPPERLVFAWDISPQWRLEPDPSHASEVEVRFVDAGAGHTAVELVHSHIDRHGSGWEGFRDGLAGDEAWPLYLRRYTDLVPTQS
jgi:uncharacterized protein YndB with AHSA1/START domain